MSSRKTRKLAKRRDRRIAKQSGWKRPGKEKPKRVGHGPGGVDRIGGSA